MIDFVSKLKEEVDSRIRVIEAQEQNVLRRSLAISEMLEEVFDRLKRFIVGYQFSGDDEEIHFFKEVKPRIFCHLLYYRKVFNIEMNRPMGTLDAQTDYLNRELAEISVYIRKRLDLYRYYRSGSTHLDKDYFLRGRINHEDQYRDSFYFERDPAFSTCGDFVVAKILSYDMLQVYLREELETIGNNRLLLSESPSRPVDNPRWTETKAALIVLLYAWDTMACFDNGKISLRRLQKHIETEFDIELGNIAKALGEIRLRQNPAAFFDKMKEAFLQRIEGLDNRNSIYKP